MCFTNKKYDFENVNFLIEKDELTSAAEYMIEYTKNKKHTSSNSELVQCRARLKRIETDHLRGSISYEIYDRYKNKITKHLIYLNREIERRNKSYRRKNVLTNKNRLAEFILIAALVFAIPYCLTKIIIPYISKETKKVEFLLNPPYSIAKLFIDHSECADSSFVSFKIENTSKHNLDSIQFVWTPDSLPNLSAESRLINLKIKETKNIQIPIDIQNKFKPDIYHSSLEEIHPVSVNRKFPQNFKVTPCEN